MVMYMPETPNSCLRTECIAKDINSQELYNSQLMSPHGMHPSGNDAKIGSSGSQLMSPHGMHRVPSALAV